MTDFLTSTQLKRLKEHKYSAQGQSVLEPQMQKFWRWLVEQIPETWAPNTITSVGLLINIVTTLLLLVWSADAKTEAPRLCYFLCGVGLFLYQSLDAIDGKQARRTGTNTPLGELFDHGCDSVSTVFVTVGLTTAMKMGEEPCYMMFEVLAGLYLFYQAHWQTYVTGTLIFNKFDVTESQFGIIGVYFICAIIGPGVWDTVVPGVGLTLRALAVVGSLLPALFHCRDNLKIIFSGGIGKNKSTIASEEEEPDRDTSTIFPVVPISIVLGLAVMIAFKSTSNLFQNHPCLYLISFGMVTAKVTNRLVIAHMTKSEMAMLDSSLFGPAMLFFNQYFNVLVPEYLLLWICCIYCTVDIVWYSKGVCQEICDFLGIYCFNITSKPEKVRPTTRASAKANK
ncbi:choline/ethanolaminephosphotransferase 1-like isoform X1 [Mizuhopecten yessoensis]|uniref:choline/ethanolaminephosphotransferase 1-like isoform X1 n=1 Tax=Mizuhopecten yessoensis TaxID=6573 RepID=UPI000B457AF4|nr:choline/ethanolaminephosphotransferase 1-like isoform X1 [Mizuhopecten yessoensis]